MALNMKIGVVGSREFGDWFDVDKSRYLTPKGQAHYNTLKALLFLFIKTQGLSISDLTIVSGRAQGADSLGEKFADVHGLNKIIHEADWENHGLSAGFKRNPLIVKDSDVVFCFWDGQSSGTLDTINLSKKANKKTIIYRYNGEKDHDPLTIIEPQGTLDV